MAWRRLARERGEMVMDCPGDGHPDGMAAEMIEAT
jgi:hypothetical protein